MSDCCTRAKHQRGQRSAWDGRLTIGVVESDCLGVLVYPTMLDVEVAPAVSDLGELVQVLEPHVHLPSGAKDKSPQPNALPGPIPSLMARRRLSGFATPEAFENYPARLPACFFPRSLVALPDAGAVAD